MQPFHDEEDFSNKYLEKYIRDLKPLAHPFFCEMCPIIRGVTSKNKTYLDAYETMLYNARGMCTKCFEYLNKNSGDPEMEHRIKMWEDPTGLTIKRASKAEK